MFKSTVAEAFADRKTIIAALAITTLAIYAFTFPINVAEANHRAFNIERTITVPCQPYCVGVPQDIDRTAGPVHIQIRFSFV
jgi:hypothetical protein